MTISDAQFSEWLARDVRRVVLCEMKFAYESGGAPAEGTVYLANWRYATQPTDTPANTSYRDNLRGIPGITRSINPDTIGGFTEVAIGNMSLDNADGSLDFLSDLIIDGREVRFYLGAPQGTPGWTRADFRLVLVALAEFVARVDDLTIDVRLRDQRLLLDREMGGDPKAGARKPMIFCSNNGVTAKSISPVQLDAALLTYCVVQNYLTAGGAPPVVANVYDNGVSLNSGSLWSVDETQITVNAGTDTLTKTGHGLSENDVVYFDGILGTYFLQGPAENVQYWVIAAGLTPDDFRVSATKGGSALNLSAHSGTGTVNLYRARYFDNLIVDGTIQLSAKAAGRLTVDARAYSPSRLSTDDVPSELVRAMLIDYGGISASIIDLPTFEDISDGSSGVTDDIWAARAVTERENLIGVLDDIARVVQMFFGPDYQGIFHAGRLNLSNIASETATRTLSSADCLQAPVISNRSIITGTVVVNSQRNSQPLSYGEIADSVTVDNARAFAGQFRDAQENTAPTGTAYSTNWQSYHRTATRQNVEGAFQASSTGVPERADQIIGDLKPHIKTIEVTTDLRAYSWRLGDVVAFTYPRHGFDAGVNCRVIGIDVDLTGDRVNLTLITRVAPDTTTASYP